MCTLSSESPSSQSPALTKMMVLVMVGYFLDSTGNWFVFCMQST